MLAVTGSGILGFSGALLLLWKANKVKNFAHYALSFAVGAMLGAVFFDLLPESFELMSGNRAALLMLVGILIMFIIEKILVLHHCHAHGLQHTDVASNNRLHASATLIGVGDFVHNFLDGVVVATAFLVSIPVGISATIAEIAHEIPQEIGDFSVMIASGMRRSRVILWNVVSELGSLLGACMVLVLHQFSQNFVMVLVPISAGGFLYIALSDLVPELHNESRFRHSLYHIVLIGCGLILLFATRMLFPE